MRSIDASKIKETVSEICIQANTVLRKDVLRGLKNALKKENNKKAGKILETIIKNASIAAEEKLAICQDTGLPLVFLEIGQYVKIRGNLYEAVQKGVELGYRRGYFRNSIVDPFLRKNPKFVPTVIYTELAEDDKLKITVLPKGFGCENKTRLKMFNPTASIKEIKDFIIDSVKEAGPDACPPFVVGVGIGGTADYACFLAKKALLKKIRNPNSKIRNKFQFSNFSIDKLEEELLTKINKLNIGPMGLGGRTTALAVNILTYPTHIAGLPVAVNISCHALRSASKQI